MRPGLLIAAVFLTACTALKEEFSRDYRVEQLRKNHPDIYAAWGPKAEQGKVFVGMPEPAAKAAWGPPDSVSRSSFSGEIWHYDWCSGAANCHFGTLWFDAQGRVEDWSTR